MEESILKIKKRQLALVIFCLSFLGLYFLSIIAASASSGKIEQRLQDINERIEKEEAAIAILKDRCAAISGEKREVINYLEEEKPGLSQIDIYKKETPNTESAIKQPYIARKLEERIAQQQLAEEYIAQKKIKIKQELLKEKALKKEQPEQKRIKQETEKPEKIKYKKKKDPEKQNRIKRHREEKKKWRQEELDRKRQEKKTEAAEKKAEKKKQAAEGRNPNPKKQLVQQQENKIEEENIEYVNPQIEDEIEGGEELYYEPPVIENTGKESNTCIDKLKEVDEYLRKNLW